MPKLNDTQLILLSIAAQRLDRNVLPLPDTLAAGASVTKAINTLVGKGLAEERETDSSASAHRVDGDISLWRIRHSSRSRRDRHL